MALRRAVRLASLGVTLVLGTAALALAAPSVAPEGDVELWAGRWVLDGKQHVPVFGEVKTRTERLVLATVRHTQKGIELVEQPCSIRLGTVAGVRLSTRDENARELPPVRIQFEQRGRELRAGPWRGVFGAGDSPTLEVRVEAPLCGGMLRVATDSTSIARARPRSDGQPGLEGEVRARIQQSVREATGTCLKKFAHDVEQLATGRLAFVRVPAGSSCTSLAGKFPLVPDEDGTEHDDGPFAGD